MRPWMIKDTDFASLVSPQDMAIFMEVCPDKRFKKGDVIFFAGDLASDLHVIAQGQVKLTTPTSSGSERILAVCGPDDFIGEAFLQDTSHYRVDAIALTDVTTCPVSREQFVHMAQKAPHFVLTFAEILASHLFQCRNQLSSSYAPVKVRLAKVLLDLIARFGEVQDKAWSTLQTNLKHEDLAAMITATRVSVSMAMAELRESGIVEGTRGQYRIHVAQLETVAEELA